MCKLLLHQVGHIVSLKCGKRFDMDNIIKTLTKTALCTDSEVTQLFRGYEQLQKTQEGSSLIDPTADHSGLCMSCGDK